MKQPMHSDLYLFEEAMPSSDLSSPAGFRSECVPDKKIKVEDLFKFKRGRGDYHVSAALLFVALFFLFFFFTHTGWEDRKLPDNLGAYLAHQGGLIELEGRVQRFGRILKQSWVIPLVCLLVLVPSALWNFRESRKVQTWRRRFQLPTDANYELSQYLRALEFVAYFVAYTLIVPLLGYLLSTIVFGMYLTIRLGYRSFAWILKSFVSCIVIVLVFRTLLQIKTPGSIWLYDQLPSALRTFMLNYF